jgi:hypothetical protein
MTDKEAMKLALEALELLTGAWQTFDALDYGGNAIAALKEQLADPMREVQRLGQAIEQKIGCVNHDCDQCKAQPEQVIQSYSGKHNLEQEPVAWMDKYGEIYKDVPEVLSTDKPLYTSPPQRQPLTKEEMFEAIRPLYSSEMSARIAVDYSEDEYRAIEAAHGIKENT